MRLVTAFAALLATGVPAAAQPVSTAPLAPGEILLEVNATGIARTRASQATISATIRSSAASQDEAEALNRDKAARISAAAHAAGVAAADIVVNSPPTVFVPVPTPPPVVTPTPRPPAGNREEGRRTAHATVAVTVRDLARLDALRRALLDAGASNVSATAFTLPDDRDARRAARVDAVAAARVDAEAYAQSLGLRVLRIVRVTERLGLDLLGELAVAGPTGARRPRPAGSPDGTIETQIVVGVDFALGPR